MNHRLAIQIVAFLLAVSDFASAQTGMGFGGGLESPLLGPLLFVVASVFGLVVLIGLMSSLGAFWSSPELEPERRRALRWIGLNWLEPSLTLFAFIVVVLLNRSFNLAGMLEAILWFFPAVVFICSLLPPVFFSSLKPMPQTVWQTLRLVAFSRMASVAVLVLSLAIFGASEISLALGIIGLIILIWSFLRLGQVATQLNQLELKPTRERILE
jgi:hypothetical protein